MKRRVIKGEVWYVFEEGEERTRQMFEEAIYGDTVLEHLLDHVIRAATRAKVEGAKAWSMAAERINAQFPEASVEIRGLHYDAVLGGMTARQQEPDDTAEGTR